MTRLVGRLIVLVVACALTAGAAHAFTFTSKEGQFVAEYPAEPKLSKAQNKTTSGIPFDQWSWVHETDADWWAVVMLKYSQEVTPDYDLNMRAAVEGTKGKLLSQKNGTMNGVATREIMIAVGDAITVRQRFIWIAKRFYQIVYSGPPADATSPKVDAFFNSVSITP